VTFNKNWGKKFDPFSPDTFQTKLSIPFYVKENGITTIRIKSEKGLVLKTLIDSSEAGLNYVAYSLTIDSIVVSSFEKSMSDSKKNKTAVVKQGEDKNYYLIAGKYTIEIETQNKNIATTTFVVKESKKDDAPADQDDRD
jgi:hypothetical protein